MGSYICRQVVLQFIAKVQAHETVPMFRVVLVRHLHFSRASQTPHVEKAVVTDGIEAARHDVCRWQVLERVDKQRRDFGIEQTWQECCLSFRIAIRILLCCSNLCSFRAIVCSD